MLFGNNPNAKLSYYKKNLTICYPGHSLKFSGLIIVNNRFGSSCGRYFKSRQLNRNLIRSLNVNVLIKHLYLKPVHQNNEK